MKVILFKIAEMNITKNLNETTQYLNFHKKIISTKKGIGSPCLKADPVYSAFKGLVNLKTAGDAVPTLANLVGAGAQTLTHATILANLSGGTNILKSMSSVYDIMLVYKKVLPLRKIMDKIIFIEVRGM